MRFLGRRIWPHQWRREWTHFWCTFIEPWTLLTKWRSLLPLKIVALWYVSWLAWFGNGNIRYLKDPLNWRFCTWWENTCESSSCKLFLSSIKLHLHHYFQLLQSAPSDLAIIYGVSKLTSLFEFDENLRKFHQDIMESLNWVSSRLFIVVKTTVVSLILLIFVKHQEWKSHLTPVFHFLNGLLCICRIIIPKNGDGFYSLLDLSEKSLDMCLHLDEATPGIKLKMYFFQE